ncbi:hypothetical protein TYRP_011640 [Tyrophagus putrescentiae]|nr:hypothetical protein TYRP_011640 [Tyrophagus putrescentiae]
MKIIELISRKTLVVPMEKKAVQHRPPGDSTFRHNFAQNPPRPVDDPDGGGEHQMHPKDAEKLIKYKGGNEEAVGGGNRLATVYQHHHQEHINRTVGTEQH